MIKKYQSILVSALFLAGLISSLVQPANAMVRKGPEKQISTIDVDPAVLSEMSAKGSTGYWIEFSQKIDLSAADEMNWSDRGWYVYNTLSKAASASQARTANYLTNAGVPYKTHWINNSIYVTRSDLSALSGLMSISGIDSIRAPRTYFLYEPDKSEAVNDNGINAIEPSLSHIHVDDVWGMGFTGSGIVVANLDTGVRYTHEALVNQYRGNNGDGTFTHDYNWFDPYGEYSVPTDNNNHGTHTMGTMVGNDGGVNQIGVAPGADWMACRACNTSNCSDVALLTCAEFVAAPTTLNGTAPNPDLRANIVNNSWGDCSQTYDGWFQNMINIWHAAGIYPVFSNGNTSNCGYSRPPGLNTVGNPARYGNVTGVGSTGNNNGLYASHSNWGPTDNPDTVNPTGGFNTMKPQVVAPGVDIRSSVAGSDTLYSNNWTGTSMSAPHVSGLVALIWQAAPCLVGDYANTENLIEQTATEIIYDDGSALTPTNYPNFATGWGEIDAWAAVNQALTLCNTGHMNGKVTIDGSTPVEGATVRAESGPGYFRSTLTAADGTYSLDLDAGNYIVTATKYGYISDSITGISIIEGETITRDFEIVPLGSSMVSGYVYDNGVTGRGEHGYPLYASIHITANGFDQMIFTDPFTGYYEIELFQNTSYSFTTNAVPPGYNTLVESITPNGVAYSHNIDLQVGNGTCSAPGYEKETLLNEHFETGILPVGWINQDYNSSGDVWAFNNPGMRVNLTPGGEGGFAILDSDDYGFGRTQDAGLRTPMLNLSAFTTVILEFDADYKYYSESPVVVRVSADNGSTWTDKWIKELANFNGHVTIDLTSEAAGKSQVIIEFKYTGSFGWWWEVDDVLITTGNCNPIPGGVVAGFVYNANNVMPLVGADVTSPTATTQTFEISADPKNFGLYWVFQPTATNPEDITFTASMDPLSSKSKTVAVNQNAIVRQEFHLGTSQISVSPISLSNSQVTNKVTTQSLEICNFGGALLSWEFIVDPIWVSENPQTGNTPSDMCSTVDVIFDSSGLSAGAYAGNLEIVNNDPDSPLITIPVTLTVNPQLFLPIILK